jgi:HKD family nuclease
VKHSLDALLLEVLGGLDTLVGGSNLDQDSLLVNTELLVKVNKLVSLGDCSLYNISVSYL